MNKIQLSNAMTDRIWDKWLEHTNGFGGNTYESIMEDLIAYHRAQGWDLHWEHWTHPHYDIAFFLPENQLTFFILAHSS